jgi:cytochrome c oxidase subunit 3
MAHSQAHDKYYIPHGTSWWPIVGSVGLTSLVVGFAIVLNSGAGFGSIMMLFGLLVTLFMLFGWFGMVVRESERHFYNRQVDASYRWSMSWFIFSEVMFFAAFFGALFYARI